MPGSTNLLSGGPGLAGWPLIALPKFLPVSASAGATVFGCAPSMWKASILVVSNSLLPPWGINWPLAVIIDEVVLAGPAFGTDCDPVVSPAALAAGLPVLVMS